MELSARARLLDQQAKRFHGYTAPFRELTNEQRNWQAKNFIPDDGRKLCFRRFIKTAVGTSEELPSKWGYAHQIKQ